MTDLVKRLRGDLPEKLVEKHWITDDTAIEMQNREAADRIEQLEGSLMQAAKEIQGLKDALAQAAGDSHDQ